MDFYNFINENENYQEILKNYGFRMNKYKDLLIISYKYDKKPEFEHDWMKLCRGAIICDNMIKCIPPRKSIEIESIDTFEHLTIDKIDGCKIESLIDGTMINLFYHNDEWLISTRSEIGGYNKWTDKKSFRNMFDECSNIDYEKLNKNYCYSFVMQHKDNCNVTPIQENKLFLTEIYEFDENNKPLKKDITEIGKMINIDTPVYYNSIEEAIKIYIQNENNWKWKGFTIKFELARYKCINNKFNDIMEINVNSNNDLIKYLTLRRNGNLKDYLKYYPMKKELFNDYRNKVHDLTGILFHTYKDVFIHKKKDKDKIEFYLNPLIYDIHDIYKQTKKPIHWNVVKQYIHLMPTKKLAFAMNRM